MFDAVKVPAGVHGVLVGKDNKKHVVSLAGPIWELLTQNGLDIPSAKCQGPEQEIKFLRIWWVAGAVALPADTLEEGASLQEQKGAEKITVDLGILEEVYSQILCNCSSFV